MARLSWPKMGARKALKTACGLEKKFSCTPLFPFLPTEVVATTCCGPMLSSNEELPVKMASAVLPCCPNAELESETARKDPLFQVKIGAKLHPPITRPSSPFWLARNGSAYTPVRLKANFDPKPEGP